MERKTKIEKYTIAICLGLLMFFALTIGTRFLTRQILIECLEMDNAFTRFVWFDNPKVGGFSSDTDEDSSITTKQIDWKALYPFDESVSNVNIVESNDSRNLLSYFSDLVLRIEEKIEDYASDKLVFYNKINEIADKYDEYINWNLSSYSEYNGIVKLSDGYLSEFVERGDTTQQYEAIYELNEFCQNKSINFLYVQAPYKISEYDDNDVSGVLDFSNQNATELLSKLKEANIDYYDIRETIHNNGMYNHDLFYKTDHHWLTTTGLWAAKNILAYCNEVYGWNADLDLLEEDQFDYITYEDWFLGSQGKKVTLSRCAPDDFTLIYPKYDVNLHYYIPSLDIDTLGDYSIVYNMSEVVEKDYYGKNPYAAYNYGNQPLIKINNLLNGEEHKILIIHESFGNSVFSYLALTEKNIDSLDIRFFTGSVKNYINESNPDLVIVMYNAGMIGKNVDYSSHQDLFDFR